MTHTHSDNCHHLSLASNDDRPHAIRLAEWFCPETVSFENRIYFEMPQPEDIQDLLEISHHDMQTVQAILNHYHIEDILAGETVTRAERIELGQRLQTCWQALFKARYPGQNIIVAFDVQDDDADEEMQIVVYNETATDQE